MKTNLKNNLIATISLVAFFSIGCKKEDIKPRPIRNIEDTIVQKPIEEKLIPLWTKTFIGIGDTLKSCSTNGNGIPNGWCHYDKYLSDTTKKFKDANFFTDTLILNYFENDSVSFIIKSQHLNYIISIYYGNNYITANNIPLNRDYGVYTLKEKIDGNSTRFLILFHTDFNNDEKNTKKISIFYKINYAYFYFNILSEV